MGELLMVEQEIFECPASAVLDAIASGALPGWRIAGGASLRAGAPITLPVTLPRTMGGHDIEVVGRIDRVVPGRKVVVNYHLPWRGSVAICAEPTGPDQCRVRITARVDDKTVMWLRTAGGYAGEQVAARGQHSLGLLVSNSGSANIFAAASENLARMAVEELNAVNGFGTSDVQLHVGDDGTNPSMGAAELVRLSRLGCRVVITNVTSATFRKLRPIARRLGILLIYTPVNEGGSSGPEVFRLGERPGGQLRGAIPRLMRLTDAKNWFLVGNDYSWPRATHRQARGVIEKRGGRVVGEQYKPLGSRDFSGLLGAIEASGAPLVISTFVGADEVAFEQQFYSAGLRSRTQTLALAMDESTCEHIGVAASHGVWTSFGYFQSLEMRSNRDFLARYRTRFGNGAPPTSSISESVYEAVHIYAAAVRDASSGDVTRIKGRLDAGISFSGPRGFVRAGAGGLRQAMFLGRGDVRGIAVVDETV
jgi:urea transport system substrate-binding protein